MIRPVSNPIKPSGHLQVLRGNVAPDGAVAKITGKEGETFKGALRLRSEARAVCERSSCLVCVARFRGEHGGRRAALTRAAVENGRREVLSAAFGVWLWRAVAAGPAIVFDSEEEMLAALSSKRIHAGMVRQPLLPRSLS